MKVTPIKASAYTSMNENERAVFMATMRSQGILPVPVNDIYLANFFRPERIQIWYGGSGAGKSDAKATELLLKCMVNKHCRVMYCRKVYDSVRMSQFQLFKDVIARYALGEFFHVTENNMTIRCKLNGNILFARGLDDVDKVMSVADITDIWIEEPIDRRGSITSADFMQLDRRLRTMLASLHIHLTFNPISDDSWIYDYFFRSDLYNPFTLKTTYLDNYFSPESQRQQFEILKVKSPDEYAVYALGEWGKLKKGLIFPDYQYVETIPSDAKHIGYGLDWGFYPDPCAVVGVAIKDGNLYLDEVIYRHYLTSETRTRLMLDEGINMGASIVADTNREAVAEMEMRGWRNIELADKPHGSIKAGIDLMSGFNIFITERSINLKKELDNYSWKTEKHSGNSTGEPIDLYNHAIDAARYRISKYLTKRQAPSVGYSVYA